LDNLFSNEFKELVSKSRDAAIELGYDYISTIHFFIADCDSNKSNSIYKFGFTDDKAYKKFKTEYTLPKVDLLDLISESLPLTKEAEQTILLTENQRLLRRQIEAYPCHFFLAALKNKESLLYDCFKHDEKALRSLEIYYEEMGEFKKGEMALKQISTKYQNPSLNSKSGFLAKIAAILKWKK